MSDQVIDRVVFNELRSELGQEFAAELVTTFLDEAPKMLADLKQAAAAGNADDFRRAAHSIKSNASVFGASHLADLSRELEISGLTGADPGCSKVAAELTRAQTALRRLLDG